MTECKNISVEYGKKTIIKDVSFVAHEGEITVIMGKNGSGKTTLLKCIASNVQYSGEVLIDGKSLKKMPPSQKSKLIAMMVQSLPDTDARAEQIVSFGRYPYTGITGILSEEDKKIVKECIKEAGIEKLSHLRYDKISGGEKRKVFFAMMLCQRTPVILLDEPTANLDNEYIGHITDMLMERKKKNDTVIVVLHDVNHALKIADRIVVMDEGRLVFEGKAEEFTKSGITEKLFGLKRCICIDDNGNEGIIYR